MPRDQAYIVTGTTRGIGRALADQIRQKGDLLYTLSRAADAHGERWHNFFCDLRYPEQVQAVMTRLMAALPFEQCSDVILINNAGVLAPIGPLEKATQQQMSDHLQVNLLAPVTLIALFMRLCNHFNGRRRVIVMTSGAARHAYAGWALYCAAKAALNMLTACVALEQQRQPQAVGICAVAPGVVATDMLQQIRQARTADFPARPRFMKLSAQRRLLSPAQAARLILELDASGQFTPGGLYDLRDVVWQQGQPTIQQHQRIDDDKAQPSVR